MAEPLKTTIDGLNVTLTETSEALMRVAKLWKRNAQGKLRREDKNATGTLTRSMRPVLGLTPDGDPFVDITPQVHYWLFVDAGVKGAVSSPFGPRQGQDPNGGPDFQYRDKAPPVAVIRSWMRTRNIKPRGEGGKFKKMTHDTLAILIAQSIRRRGLRPTHFITDTGARIEAKYSVEIAVAYANDVAAAIVQEVNRLNNGNND